MGRIGRAESIRLVHAALECGVTHVDTARVYGFGDAERMLGAALKGRSDVEVYTKVGQGHSTQPRLRSSRYALARPVARLRARLRDVGSEGAKPGGNFVRRTDFSIDHVRQSVETSLRMLRREALDGLLLHEITAEELSPELVGVLDDLRLAGKIRRYGVASETRALTALSAVGMPGDIVQQAGGPFFDPVAVHHPMETILHSVFGAKGQELRRFYAWLESNTEAREQIRAVVQGEGLHGLAPALLSYTASSRPCASLIFASTSLEHVRRNAFAVQHGLSDESIKTFSAVIAAYRTHRQEG